jgi:hypothetical protein
MTLKDSVYNSISRSLYINTRQHVSHKVIAHTTITCWHPVAANIFRIVNGTTVLNAGATYTNNIIKSYET